MLLNLTNNSLWLRYDLTYIPLRDGQTCGGTVTAAKGTITSPGYPDLYGDNLKCEWTLAVYAGHKMEVTVSVLEIGAASEELCTTNGDRLELRDNEGAQFTDSLDGTNQ